jgi:hypothetical protein
LAGVKHGWFSFRRDRVQCYNQNVDGGSSSVAERLTVAQDVVGSIPTRRPISCRERNGCYKFDSLSFRELTNF